MKVFELKTQLFSSYHPDIIEDAILSHLRNVAKIEPKINEKKYKIKFQLVSKDQGDQEQVTEICIRILKVDEETICVEFQKLSGNQTRFHDHFSEFNTNILGFANDTN